MFRTPGIIPTGPGNDVLAIDPSCQDLTLASRDAGPVLSGQSTSSVQADARVKPEDDVTGWLRPKVNVNAGWYKAAAHRIPLLAQITPASARACNSASVFASSPP